jgi:4-hydroxybenzoate polyprenyltransferase
VTIRADGTQLTRARLVTESASRLAAICLVASINVAGWMVLFRGAWRIGLWIVLLSAGMLSVVLWEQSERRG